MQFYHQMHFRDLGFVKPKRRNRWVGSPLNTTPAPGPASVPALHARARKATCRPNQRAARMATAKPKVSIKIRVAVNTKDVGDWGKDEWRSALGQLQDEGALTYNRDRDEIVVPLAAAASPDA